LCLVWPNSPDLGLFIYGGLEFVALGLEGRRGSEGTRFGLLRPSWRGRIWSSLGVVDMVGMGSRSSFEWWYFQEDRSSFEFSFCFWLLHSFITLFKANRRFSRFALLITYFYLLKIIRL
jgi:hypothetical protein